MNGVGLFIIAIAAATVPTGNMPPPLLADEATAIDLTGDLAADTLGIDPQARRYEADIYPCGRLADTLVGHPLLGTVRAGALFFSRDRAQAQPSSKVFRAADDAVLLDAANLDLGTATGLDITLILALGESNELEVRYFGLDSWNASQTASDPGGVRFEGFGVATLAQADRVDYASRLYNVEVNLRPRVGTVPLVLGFRTLQLHERFELSRLAPQPGGVLIGTRANNFLYGFQLGAEPVFLGQGALRLEGAIKAGVYGNVASQSTAFPAWGATLDSERVRTSFVGELGLTGAYQLTKGLSVRVGYELLWVHGVALAPDQSSSTQFLPPFATVNASATSLYQGATATLEFAF